MKKQKVNWKLYLVIGFLSINITFSSLIVKGYVEWFTILSGIGCGAFASVLIAFLIEITNVAQKNLKNISIFASFFAKLHFSFANLLSSFAIACDKDGRKKAEDLRWFEWLEKLIQEQSKKTTFAMDFLVDKFQDTQKEITKIEENKLTLLNLDLIEDMEFVLLKEIQLDLSIIESELKKDIIEWSNVKMTASELKGHIEESKILRKLNKVTYKDNIWELLHTRCYLDTKIVDNDS